MPDGSRLTPPFEGDLIEATLGLELVSDTSVVFATYGVSDRFDIGVAVPFVRVELNASVLRTDRETVDGAGLDSARIRWVHPDEQTFGLSGVAAGIGDIVVRAKYGFNPASKVSFGVGFEARLPTGDEANLLGTGGVQTKVFGIASMNRGRFEPHVNVGKPVCGIERHGLRDQRVEPRVHRRPHVRQARHGPDGDARDDFVRAARVGWHVRDELEQRAAEREHVAAAIERTAGHLFGRHVAKRAGDVLRHEHFALQHAGDPEVQHFEHATLVEHQVVGLYVEVHDVRPVRVGQARACALDELEPARERKGARRRIKLRSVSPATCSIAMYGLPACSPASKMVTMFGCRRRPAARASCTRRRRASSSSIPPPISLTATSRSSTGSCAR